MTQKCYKHAENDAIGTCRYCGRHLCTECIIFNKKGKYYHCKKESDCMAYQESQLDPMEANKKIRANEATLEKYVQRLSEVIEELGEIRKMFEESAARMNPRESESELMRQITNEVNRNRISGFCAYKLAEESMALLSLIAIKVIFLKDTYEQLGSSTRQQKLTHLQNYMNEVEPIIRQTLDDMAPYSTLDSQKIIESMCRLFMTKTD
jgi:hypothetical protein